jgi:hypothetical protein
MQPTELYEYDFNEWIAQQITLLKQGRTNEIDAIHLITELEEMGKSNLRELESRFIILIAHLLKWQFQPNQQDGSWRDSINEQRLQLSRLLRKTPSLKRELINTVTEVYLDALELATDDTGLAASIFPTTCPYSIEQLLDKTFYP